MERMARGVRSGVAWVAMSLWLGWATVATGQQLDVVSFDTSSDGVVSGTAFLLTALGTQYQGVLLSSAIFATSDSFAADLANGFTNLAIVDLTNDVPNGDWPAALGQFIAGGGCAIVTVRDPADAALVAGFLGATLGASHDALPIVRWNDSPLFDSSQTVPSPLAVADNVLEPNGFFLEPAGGSTAAAGFAPDPTPNQAAIVIGNGGRTILHGFLTDDFDPGDVDGDTVADARELAENEIFSVGLAGCTPAGQGVVEVPTLDAAGAALFALALLAAATWLLRRRRATAG